MTDFYAKYLSEFDLKFSMWEFSYLNSCAKFFSDIAISQISLTCCVPLFGRIFILSKGRQSYVFDSLSLLC